MAYKVDAASVADDVGRFSDRVLKAWVACLAEIEADPYPHFGFYVDRAIPILGFPMRTWIYDIAQETSISGESVYVFTAEFFPEYATVYVIDEGTKEIVVLFLREKHRA